MGKVCISQYWFAPYLAVFVSFKLDLVRLINDFFRYMLKLISDSISERVYYAKNNGNFARNCINGMNDKYYVGVKEVKNV